MTKFLTRDEILSKQDRKTEVLRVPEWDCDVRIMEMSAADREAYERMILRVNAESNQVETDISNLRAKLVALAVVDEEGKRVFTDEDVEALSQKNHQAIKRIYTKALSLNLIGEEEAVDEEAKN